MMAAMLPAYVVFENQGYFTKKITLWIYSAVLNQ